MIRLLNLSNKIIKFSFYGLFFLVPLVFWKDTSELYELNKMWLTFGFTLLIAAFWVVKSIVSKKFYLQRTPLDLPIGFFLASQIVSTIFSLDPYVSFWGYYSRFNGGLLSTICYIILYYAFVSNFDLKTEALEIVKKILGLSLISGVLVALWGLPSHFGYDPTCLIFRGSFDVSCWTSDFQPKVRIFSTLGQPAWLGAYLAILIPLLFAYFLNAKNKLHLLGLGLLTIIFYVDLLFTRSRAALIGFWVSALLFSAHYLFNELGFKLKNLQIKKVLEKTKPFLLLLVLILVATGVILNPIEFKGKVQIKKNVETKTGSFSSGGGGTESGKIRLYVWEGAIKAWLHNPIIGTGVETFAFAYYKYKPVAHNLTSEWNYLYNKAHNEYLNYLTTSGILGLGSYLFIIFSFFYHLRKLLNKKTDLVVLALVAGYISILITNFFGFSVVIVNLYFFLIPAFVFVLLEKLNPKNVLSFSFGKKSNGTGPSFLQKVDIVAVLFATIYLLIFLGNFWLADQAFSLGSNLANAGEYSSSYASLKEAIQRIGFEPTYKDELARNDGIFTVAILSSLTKDSSKQKEALSFAESLAKESIFYADQLTKDHPNNVVFWKTRVTVFNLLSQIDPKYNGEALNAIKKAQELAPTDPKISYSLALLYDQTGDTKKGIETLKRTIELKPNLAADYPNPYYALGLFYRKLATDKDGKVVDADMNRKAIEEMQYILKLDPNNKDAKDALETFQK